MSDKKISPLTGLIKYASKQQADEARLIRQQRLLERITTSTDQYEYLLERYSVEKLDKIIKQLEHFKYGISASAPAVCFEPGSKVVMADGTLKNIEDIQVGDYILNSKCLPDMVINVMSRNYEGALFRFKFGPGTGKRKTPWSTANHEFLVKDRKWIKAADLRKNDFLTIPYRATEDTITDRDKAEAMLLGYYLAEGSLQIDIIYKGKSRGSKTNFSFHIKEVEYRKEIEWACSVLGYNKPKEYSYPNRGMGCQQVISGKSLAVWLLKMGGKYCDQKLLAQEVLNWPKEKLRILLLCYINGDGHYKESRTDERRKHCAEASWVTTSKQLSEQLTTIAYMIGLAPSLPIYNIKRPGHKQGYYGYIGEYSLSRLLGQESELTQNYSEDEDNLYVRITGIETKYYNGPVYNIEVQNEHTYCVNWILVHNCMGPLKCPFYHACPIGGGYSKDAKTGARIPLYDDINDFPIGDQCIVEKVFVEQKLIDYIQEFDIDPARPSELALINDLALCDLYKNRAVLFMAAGDKEGEGVDFMKVDTVDASGEAMSSQSRSYKEHPAFGVIDKLEKRRHKILEELLATRRAKATAVARFGAGAQTSQLMTEIEKLRKAIETKRTRSLIESEDQQDGIIDVEAIEEPDLLELD